MPDNDAAVFVTLFKGDPDEKRLRLVLPGDGWNFEEALVATDVSNGQTPAEIEGGLLQGDPRSWLAVLRVSYMRDGDEFPSQRIMNENVVALMKALADETRRQMQSRPPTNPNGSGSDEPSESKPIVEAAPQS